MILPDFEIERRCDPSRYKNPLVSPFKQSNLQPASVDLTLSDHLLIPKSRHLDPWMIDLDDISGSAGPNTYKSLIIDEHGVILSPQSFILGSTNEAVHIPPALVGRVEGKSSLGRLGILVHSTAGFIDPGFSGTITLEFYNLNCRPIILHKDLQICQISFTELTVPARKPYGHKDLGSKYQNQQETTASKYRG